MPHCAGSPAVFIMVPQTQSQQSPSGHLKRFKESAEWHSSDTFTHTHPFPKDKIREYYISVRRTKNGNANLTLNITYKK